MRNIILGVLLFTSGLFAQQIYATFDVVALKKANVAFSSSGIVDKLYVDIGSVVKEGDTLAILDNDDRKALLNIKKTTLKFAKKDLERQKKIQNIIDKEKFDRYASKYESAKAEVVYQQTLLDKTILKSPFTGIIISKEIESGDVVSGQMIKTAFKIQSENKRKIILKFDQKYHAKVKIGDIYRYKIDGDEKFYEGVISKIYPFSDTKTRKISAEIEAENILVGLFGDGYITSK